MASGAFDDANVAFSTLAEQAQGLLVGSAVVGVLRVLDAVELQNDGPVFTPAWTPPAETRKDITMAKGYCVATYRSISVPNALAAYAELAGPAPVRSRSGTCRCCEGPKGRYRSLRRSAVAPAGVIRAQPPVIVVVGFDSGLATGGGARWRYSSDWMCR